MGVGSGLGLGRCFLLVAREGGLLLEGKVEEVEAVVVEERYLWAFGRDATVAHMHLRRLNR